MFVTIALGIIQMPNTEANASVTTIGGDPQHPQAQSNNLPTITIKDGTEHGFTLESTQAAPFILTRSDTAAGTLTVDVRVTQSEFGNYVASENLGEKTLTLVFGTDGTAQYEVPTLIHSHHVNGHVDVEILADSTDPAEYSIGEPSSARVILIHEHEPTPVPDPTATPVIISASITRPFLLGPDDPVPEGTDAEFTLFVGCGPGGDPAALPPCGDVTINLRVTQSGDYIDTLQYDSPEEHHHDEDDEGHHDEDDEQDDHEEDEHHDDAFQFQTVIIPNGSGRTTFSVPTDDDDIAERDGRIVVFIVGVDNDWTSGTIVLRPVSGSGDVASATIKSDDLPAVTVSKRDESARTEGDNIVFQLDRTGPMLWPEVPVRVQVDQTGNFLQGNETTTVTIPANQVSTTHSVRTVNDSVDEDHGSVTLTLLDDTADPATYRVGVANSATVAVADDDPLDLRFDDPDDATRERVPIINSIPVPQSGSTRYTLQLSRQPTSDITVRIESDNPDVTIQPSQIIFTAQPPQTLSISQTAQTSNPQTSTFSARSSLAPDIAHAMYTADSQAPLLTVPWDYPAPVNIIPKKSLTSGMNANLTHRLNCLVSGSGCGYSGEEEYISAHVVAHDVARPLIYRIEWHQGNDRIPGYVGPIMTYTAPSAPGTYTVNARVASNACSGDSDDCSAKFEIKVRHPSTPQPQKEPAVNPPGQIPTVIVDADGKQYEVFTPEQGGKFDNAKRYSIAADPGAVPNGEIVGVRMSESGAASNSGMTQHRYTLGGNSYAIHIVDASGNEINTYPLNAPANVCIPLPHELRSNISDLALISLNSSNALTILSARVRLDHDGPSVCGNISSLPVIVAVGTRGSPALIPVPPPEPAEANLPETGATAPSSNTAARLLILGILIAIIILATALRRSRAPRT